MAKDLLNLIMDYAEKRVEATEDIYATPPGAYKAGERFEESRRLFSQIADRIAALRGLAEEANANTDRRATLAYDVLACLDGTDQEG